MNRNLIDAGNGALDLTAQDEVLANDAPGNQARKEVAFVDTSVADYRALEAAIPAGIEVVRIDSNQGGLAQIAAWAASHSGYDAIHILSHGSEGALHLGRDTVTEASLATDAVRAQWSAIGRSLVPGGDLMLYGCDVAAGTQGQQFIADLRAATGADVAASIDRTGLAALGGNWNLEQRAGDIQTASLALTSYDQVLAGLNITYDFEGVSAFGGYTAVQTKSGLGLQITSTSSPLYDAVSHLGGGLLNGANDLIAGGDPGIDGGETKLTFMIGSGYYFNLNSITLLNDGSDDTFLITVGGATQQMPVAAGAKFTWNVFSFNDISSFTITSTYGRFFLELDDIVLSNIALNAAPANSVSPSINGSATVGTALSATSGTWSDPEGNALTYTYQWYRASDSGGTGAVLISGQTNSSYVPTTADAHQYLRVVVAANDGHGNQPTANSAWTAVDDTAPHNSALPTVGGVSTINNYLMGAKGGWTDADGDGLTYTYQWFRADDSSGTGKTAIGGATGINYQMSAADVHAYLSLQVTADDGHGGQSSASSTWTAGTNSVPHMNSAPVMTGTAAVGLTLAASDGSWVDADGDPISFTYQWYRADDSSLSGLTAIAGATDNTYTLTSADAHKWVRILVSAHDGYGAKAGIISFIQVADSKPVNTDLPAVSGNIQVGSALTATSGAWTDADGDTSTYSYQWYRADDASGTNAVAITGPTASAYTLASPDGGNYVSVKVTANDGYGGQAVAASSWSPVPRELTVSSIVRAGASAVADHNATSVQFTVTFSEAVTGVDAGDFTVAATGSASGAIQGITGSGDTYTVTVASIAGEGTLQVDLNDAGTGIQTAGNTVMATGYHSGQSYTLDHIAPAAPAAPDLLSSTDTGSSPSDKLTSNPAPTFVGSAEAGSTVTLYDGAKALGSTTAAADGSWSVTPAAPLLERTYSLVAKATDAAGNVSPASAALAITIDITAPATSVTGVAFSVDTGSSATDLQTSVAAQTISGTLSAPLAADETVVVSLDNGATWTSAIASGNSWSLAGQVLAASGTLQVKVADAAGNGGAVYSHAYVLDTAAPAFAFSNVSLSADAGLSGTDFITNVASQTISATLSAPLAAGDIVYGSLDAGVTWTDITAKVAGTTLTWNGATLNGSSSIQLKASDAAGNDGSLYTQAYVLDTHTLATAADRIAFSADTGVSATDLVTSTAAQTISGTLSATLDAGQAVLVSLDDGATWTAATAATGQSTWTLAGQVLAGSGTIKVKVSDTAGNHGAVFSQAYVFDTTAPAIAISGLAPASDTGMSSTDGLTNQVTPAFRGTAEAGALVKLYDTDGTTLLGSATADSSGNWSITASTMAAGVHNVSATATPTPQATAAARLPAC